MQHERGRDGRIITTTHKPANPSLRGHTWPCLLCVGLAAGTSGDVCTCRCDAGRIMWVPRETCITFRRLRGPRRLFQSRQRLHSLLFLHLLVYPLYRTAALVSRPPLSTRPMPPSTYSCIPFIGPQRPFHKATVMYSLTQLIISVIHVFVFP